MTRAGRQISVVIERDADIGIKDFIINNFHDVQTPTWLKVSGAVAYTVQIIGCMILITFIIYERKGSFGQYRTVINHLNTWLYAIVVIYCVVTVGIDFTRLTHGPMPAALCDWNAILKNTLAISGTALNVAVAFFKFMFLCVWKSYRQMNHKLITAFIGMSSVMIAFLMSLAFTFGPGKTPMYIIICTSTFQPSENLLGPRINTTDFAINSGLVTYVGFMVPITIQRWLNQKKDKKYQKNQQVDLITLISNLGILIMLTSTALVHMDMDKYTLKDQVDVLDIWMHPMYMYFISPLCIMVIMVARMLIKLGEHFFRR